MPEQARWAVGQVSEVGGGAGERCAVGQVDEVGTPASGASAIAARAMLPPRVPRYRRPYLLKGSLRFAALRARPAVSMVLEAHVAQMQQCREGAKQVTLLLRREANRQKRLPRRRKRREVIRRAAAAAFAVIAAVRRQRIRRGRPPEAQVGERQRGQRSIPARGTELGRGGTWQRGTVTPHTAQSSAGESINQSIT